MTAPLVHTSLDGEIIDGGPVLSVQAKPEASAAPCPTVAKGFPSFTVMAAFGMAAFSSIVQAPIVATLGCFALGLAGLLIQARRSPPQAEAENPSRRNAPAARLESLADRMWELHETEEHFRGLIDALGDLVIHRDREGRIVHTNQVFAKLLGR